MSDLAKLVSEIDALAQQATKGPLEQREDMDYYQGGLYIGERPYHYGKDPETGLTVQIEGRPTGTHANPLDCYFHKDVARVESQEDADFLMALVNAWPQLREAARDAERYRWLRDMPQGALSADGSGPLVVTDKPSAMTRYVGPLAGKHLDAAIDAAIDAALAAGKGAK